MGAWDYQWSLAWSAVLLSMIGDVGVAVAVSCTWAARQRVTLRFLAAFAVADGALNFAELFGDLLGTHGWACLVQAVWIWYTTWASWAWTCAYAWAVHRSFVLLKPLERRHERNVHVVCWGLPLPVVAVGLSLGWWGGSQTNARGVSHSPDWKGWCTFTNLHADLMSKVVLMTLAILYNIGCFVAVHRRIRDSQRLALLHGSGGSSLASDERERATRRSLQLWPRFLLYTMSFCGTQLPDILLDLLSVFGVRVPAPAWVFSQTACQLHGFFNGCIFCYYYGGYMRERVADRMWSPSESPAPSSPSVLAGRARKHAVFPGGEAFGEGRAEDGNRSPLIDAAS